MNKFVIIICMVCLWCFNSNGQACTGGLASSPSICQAREMDYPGVAPLPSAFTPEINGKYCTTYIHFKIDSTFFLGGRTISIQGLRIDSITKLPSGLCWSTNKITDSFATLENGCLPLNGTCCDTPGQYRLNIYLTIDTDFGAGMQVTGASLGWFYYLRVNNVTDTVARPIDTTGQANSNSTSGFRPYLSGGINQIPNCAPVYVEPFCPPDLFSDFRGVTNVSDVMTINIAPNPFSDQTIVSFYSDEEANMTEKLTNMLGSVVYSREMNVRMGQNQTVIERNNLSSGVYFYTLSNGKSLITRKLIVE